MDLHYIVTFQIEVMEENKLLSQVTWSGSTFHTFVALNEKVFCPKPVLNMGSVILFLVAPL